MYNFFRRFLFLVFLLSACQSVHTDITPTSNLLEITPSKSVSQTPNVLTITPPPIPSSTSTSAITHIELPTWVKDPENDLVLFTYDDDIEERPSTIGFFNPEDGQQVIVQLPHEIYQYYWKDATHIEFIQGYCDEPPESITELDISQGTIGPSSETVFPKDIRSCYPTILHTEKGTTRMETGVEVVDSLTGEWIPLTDPNDDITDIEYKVSLNQEYVAIVQAKGEYTFTELWQPLFGTQVSIYHLPNRKRLATFAESQMILSMPLFAGNESLIFFRENTPCVVMLSSLTKRCLDGVPDRFPDATIIPGDPLVSPNEFSFLYFDVSPHQGGFCIYNLISDDIDCPTDRFESLKDQTILNFSLSPYNRYLLIEYDYKGCPAPWCDYAGDPQIAVINIEESHLFEIGSSSVYQVMDIFRLGQPWRPKP